MRRSAITPLLTLLALVSLAACQTPPPENEFPEVTWAHKAPYRLAVSQIVIDRQYRTKSQLPNVEERAPLSPVKAAADWAGQRLLATGGSGQARFIIREGSILRSELQTKGGITGLFSNDQSRRYEANIKVEILVTDGQGNLTGQVTAEALHSRSVAENATLNERERILFRVVEQAIRTLDAELDKEIPRYLAGVLR